jgi:hypothetical protein
MAIQSLDVTRITIGYLSVAATGRLTITTIGDESSWRAEFLVRAVLDPYKPPSVRPPAEVGPDVGEWLNVPAVVPRARSLGRSLAK